MGNVDEDTESGQPLLRKRRLMVLAALIATVLLAAVWWWQRDSSPEAAGELTVSVQRRLPHDASAFTQGLEVVNGEVIESTGLYRRSTARRWNLDTGTTTAEVEVPKQYFAEGMTELPDGRLVQLTWKEGTALVRDPDTLREVDRFTYQGEGWGICMDETTNRLIMSDGSATLTFRDPVTFKVTGTEEVTDANDKPVTRLNELECVAGRVWANVWQTDTIVGIDAATGRLVATVDASGLLSDEQATDADVLNGIAALPDDEFLITGKLWPEAFVVRFVPIEDGK